MKISKKAREIPPFLVMEVMERAGELERQGADYVFCNAKHICEKTGLNSYDLAFDILEKAHVAVTPGTDFGPGGEGYIRLSYATHYDRIVEGMNRL